MVDCCEPVPAYALRFTVCFTLIQNAKQPAFLSIGVQSVW